MTLSSPFILASCAATGDSPRGPGNHSEKWRKTAKKQPLLLGSRKLGGDDLAREGEALAAARLAAAGAIGAGGAGGAGAGSFAHLALANRITDANDHEDRSTP